MVCSFTPVMSLFETQTEIQLKSAGKEGEMERFSHTDKMVAKGCLMWGAETEMILVFVFLFARPSIKDKLKKSLKSICYIKDI